MNIRDFLLNIIVIIIAIIAVLWIFPAFKELRTQQLALQELQQRQLEQEKKLNELIKANTELEKNDPYRLQKVARETYRYCYPGEKIYQFPQASGSKK